MSEADITYFKFRTAYEASKIGPQQFSYGPTSDKRAVRYLDFPHRLPLGFFPVVAIRLHGKIEFLWPDAKIIDEALWPAHFLWINLAIHSLISAYAGPSANYEAGNIKGETE